MLGLVGATVVGRLSDGHLGLFGGDSGVGGRKACLYIGSFAALASVVLGLVLDDKRGLFLSMVPAALLQQNFSVWKAVLADYAEGLEEEDDDGTGGGAAAARAASVGKLGMSAGLAFMVGPFIGAVVVDTYERSSYIAIAMVMLSTLFITRMPPSPPTMTRKTTTSTASSPSPQKNKKSGLLDLTSTVFTPTALFLVIIRVNMALAFHIYSTIWTASLKERFDFTPRDHGTFMSFIGLVYALSQGYISPRLLANFTKANSTPPQNNKNEKVLTKTDSNPHRGRIQILQLACITLGIGRVIAFKLTDIRLVYAVFFLIVVSLGLVNTVLTVDAGRCVPQNEIGGLYGILDAAQSAAGMIGPVVGGGLVRIRWGGDGMGAPLGTVVALYAVVWIMVTLGYEKFVLGVATMGSTVSKANEGSVHIDEKDVGVVGIEQRKAAGLENKKDL